MLLKIGFIFRGIYLEDESIPANYLKKILKQSGHHVIGIADSKESALKYIDVSPLDLVLIDIKLKGKEDGIETAKIFQSRTSSAILFITAYSDAMFLERAKDINSIGYLVKPAQPNTLLSTIEIGMSQFKQNVTIQHPTPTGT